MRQYSGLLRHYSRLLRHCPTVFSEEETNFLSSTPEFLHNSYLNFFTTHRSIDETSTNIYYDHPLHYIILYDFSFKSHQKKHKFIHNNFLQKTTLSSTTPSTIDTSHHPYYSFNSTSFSSPRTIPTHYPHICPSPHINLAHQPCTSTLNINPTTNHINSPYHFNSLIHVASTHIPSFLPPLLAIHPPPSSQNFFPSPTYSNNHIKPPFI